MRRYGIVGVFKPATVRTTIPAEEHPPLPDLVDRRFAPAAPDVAWCGDITYVATGEGWLYVASVLDLGSRRLLGYSMAEHMRTELVSDALEMAAAARGGQTAGIIFHGDRASQYMSGEYRELIADLDMVQSVGRTGVCWDNAVAESFWSSLKREVVARYRFPREPMHAVRSSRGSTATTITDSTRASATYRPSSGNSSTVKPRPTRPRNPRDRSTGGTSVYVQEDGRWWGNVVVRAGGSLLMEDCTIKPTATTPNPARAQPGVLQSAGGPVTIRRCDISGSTDGGLLGDNATIEDSWYHDFTPYYDPTTGAPAHKGSFMTMGGSHIRITRCRFETNNPTPYNAKTNPGGFDPSTQTGAILLQPWDPISDVVIEDLFLMGGYYALRMQSSASTGGANLTGLVVSNNVFGPAPQGGGNYTYDKAVQLTQCSGNVRGDVNGNPDGSGRGQALTENGPRSRPG
jgi:transposase InsO family protein